MINIKKVKISYIFSLQNQKYSYYNNINNKNPTREC